MTEKLERIPDWADKLTALFERRQGIPFAWGGNDCVSFACDAVEAITGRDPLGGYRGRYASEAEALEHLAGLDSGFIGQMKALFRPLPHVALRRLWRGDVALIRQGKTVSVGVFNGGQFWAPSDSGITPVPFKAGLRGWGVGHE